MKLHINTASIVVFFNISPSSCEFYVFGGEGICHFGLIFGSGGSASDAETRDVRATEGTDML